MRQDIHQEELRETKLSTAALAHVDDETATEREVPVEASAWREPDFDRPPTDGGPTLAQPSVSLADTARPVLPAPDENGNRLDTPANRPAAVASTASDNEQAGPLLSEQESNDFFARWDALQVGFIDEPRHSVEQADSLVAGTMKRLAEVFAEERARLEQQWDRGDNVSTEDLRVAMRRYRSFFRRLLAV